jgi:Trypsin
MRLKSLSVVLGVTLVTGLATAPPSHATEPTPITPAIIGGTTVPDGAAPWGAQVNVGGGFCSGSVIGPLWVLTAAHCGRGGSVRVGSQRLGQGRSIGVVQDFTNGDMALKKLASSANLSQYLPWSATAPPMGATVQIYGWGGISAPGGPLAQSLKTANLRVVGVGSTIDGAPINGQAYFGDSGGPMVFNGRAIGTCTGPIGSAPDPSQLTVAYQSAPARAAWIQQTTGIPPGGGGDPGPGPGDGVVFFQHTNFGGASSQALAPGSYTLSALLGRGFQNDWASSVRVPSGRSVTMFQHDNFQGTQWTVSSDEANFLRLQPSANDQVSSVIVR